MTDEIFNQKFFKANRQRLRKEAKGAEIIVLTANGLLQRNGDTALPFRQDSSFWYLTGLDIPDLILVMTENQEFLVLPEREDWHSAFDGEIDESQIIQTSGISLVLDPKVGWRKLTELLKSQPTVATLHAPPAYNKRYGLFSNPARQFLIDRLNTKLAEKVTLQDLRKTLTDMRAVKQDQELAAIQRAIDATARAVKLVHKNRALYHFEYEVEADITAAFLRNGLDHSFSPIVATGVNACTMHYKSNNARIQPQTLMLLDIGAEAHNYAADISRTFPVSVCSKRQKEVFEAVKTVQEQAMSELKPGVFIREYEKKVEQYMGEQLKKLGLIKQVDREKIRAYYPHSTSHFLGLDTHDVGDYDQPLTPNMVLTVEPGIYIPEEGIGVRIEDDVLITKTGIKNLSEKLPLEF